MLLPRAINVQQILAMKEGSEDVGFIFGRLSSALRLSRRDRIWTQFCGVSERLIRDEDTATVPW